MAPPFLYFNLRKVLLFLFISLLFCASSSNGTESRSRRRRMLGIIEKDVINKNKNITKLIIKSNLNLSTKTQTKPTSFSTKSNQTHISKSTNSTKISPNLKKLNSTSLPKKKLNSTSMLTTNKKLNSTSKSYNSTKNLGKTSDLLKLASPNKNKTVTKPPKQNPQILKQIKTGKVDQNAEDDDDDLVSEFRDLPSKFQQTILPDFEKISMASKKYITKANKEMTKGFKPIVGHKYASISATVVSFSFILIPLLLVSLVVNRIKAYFSIQKIVIFIQVYLSIYFSILCVSSIVTGLEPLKFFYASSQSTYVCLMVLQTLGYALYLLLLVMYLILVFSTESGLGSKLLGLAQIFVGLAVGLHFYLAVFHRVVLHQPPKTNWKIHGVYATCFLLICLFANFDRRKKAYLEDGGEEGKKN